MVCRRCACACACACRLHSEIKLSLGLRASRLRFENRSLHSNIESLRVYFTAFFFFSALLSALSVLLLADLFFPMPNFFSRDLEESVASAAFSATTSRCLGLSTKGESVPLPKLALLAVSGVLLPDSRRLEWRLSSVGVERADEGVGDLTRAF